MAVLSPLRRGYRDGSGPRELPRVRLRRVRQLRPHGERARHGRQRPSPARPARGRAPPRPVGRSRRVPGGGRAPARRAAARARGGGRPRG